MIHSASQSRDSSEHCFRLKFVLREGEHVQKQ